MLNTEVFQNIQIAQKKILVITKYWDESITANILNEVQESFPKEFYGLGENRIESIQEKNIPRKDMHFIGNIQSQKIAEIVKYCSTIHSLTNLKHAQKIENFGQEISVFIQIRLDENKNIGISESELGDFLKTCKDFKYLKIIGISGMGSGEYSEQKKRDEFQYLISLRNKYIPNGLISAGTSRDYEIALEEGIDIVRVGRKVLDHTLLK